MITVGIALVLGADVYAAARLSQSPLIRQFEYGSRKSVNATALLRRVLPPDDLREYRLEEILQEQHGFRCQPVNGVSRCLYIKRGLLNCAHSIGLDLHFDEQQNLSSAIGDSYVGCDG